MPNNQFYKFLLLLLVLSLSGCGQKNKISSEIAQLEKKGDFTQAQNVISTYLKQNHQLPEPEKKHLESEAIRLERIRHGFNLTRAALLAELNQNLKNFSETEFDQWEEEGRFEYRMIDGQRWYHYASKSNLFFRYPDVKNRQITNYEPALYHHFLMKHIQEIKREAMKTGKRYVAPERFRCVMTVSVNPNVVPAGENVRCWLPFPRSIPTQKEILLFSALPANAILDSPLSPIRSSYQEQIAQADSFLTFSTEYEFVSYASYVQVNPDSVKPYDPSSEDFSDNIAEKLPHMQFNRELKALAKEIVQDEKNPYRKAQKIYAWIVENTRYSYMVEYATLPNIPMFLYENRFGDCGVEALFFITLCRISGVPARWQSGWFILPGEKTIHDWAEFYIEPYGWLPCDPYMGVYANHYIKTLNHVHRQEIQDFYFGNLDVYRMVANGDCCAELTPTKNFIRSDNVDFQRGELEWSGGNIEFWDRSYNLDVEAISVDFF